MDSLENMPNVAEKPKTRDKLPKRSIHSSDSNKYMSCIKLVSTLLLFIYLSDTELAEKQHYSWITS